MLLSCSNVLRGLLPLWALWGGLLGRFEAGREDFCLQLCFSLLSLGKATSILAAAEVLDELSRPVVVHVCVCVNMGILSSCVLYSVFSCQTGAFFWT